MGKADAASECHPDTDNEKSPPGRFHLYYFCTFAKIYRLITASGRPSNMAIRYYNDDCTFRLPQKRLTAAWLREVAEAEAGMRWAM